MAFQKGRQRLVHVDGDVRWVHRSKGDLLEARGESRTNKGKYPEKAIEIQVYGKKYYVDIEGCIKYIQEVLDKRGW